MENLRESFCTLRKVAKRVKTKEEYKSFLNDIKHPSISESSRKVLASMAKKTLTEGVRLSESVSQYLTVYEEDRQWVPQEGGGYSYGLRAVGSYPVTSVEEAREIVAEFAGVPVESEEVQSEDEYWLIPNEYGEMTICAIENDSNRGNRHSPAKTWDQGEFGYEAPLPKFDEKGKLIEAYPGEGTYKAGPYWYYTKHGVGPGMLPKGYKVEKTVEDENFGTYVALDQPLTAEEEKEYELIKKKPEMNESEYVPTDEYTLEKGDDITIWWRDPSWDKNAPCYARCTYTGRTRDGKYKFQSNTYGHMFLVDATNNTVITPDGKEFPLDTRSGWTKIFNNGAVQESLKLDESLFDFDDEAESGWEKFATKQVLDSDGFWTDYTWYTDGERHIFIFGDNEVYTPENSDFDWECETAAEAQEWFDSYNGFEDDLVEGYTLKESEQKPLYKKPDGSYIVRADSGKGFSVFNKHGVSMGGIDDENGDMDDQTAIDRFKKGDLDESLTEGQQLNEGPGAGYSIKSEGYSVNGQINSVAVQKLQEHHYTAYALTCDVSLDGVVGTYNAEAAYTGTGDVYSLPIRCSEVYLEVPGETLVDWKVISDEDFQNDNVTESTIDKAMLLDLIKEELSESSCEFAYGGGWSHATYDGQVTDDDWLSGNYYSDMKATIYLSNEEDIKKVDRMTQGVGYETVYAVGNGHSYDEYFESEEEAIEYAKQNGYTKVITEYHTETWDDDFDVEFGDVVWYAGMDVEESVDPSLLTDCPECGDTSFNPKSGRCTKCSYRESLQERNLTRAESDVRAEVDKILHSGDNHAYRMLSRFRSDFRYLLGSCLEENGGVLTNSAVEHALWWKDISKQAEAMRGILNGLKIKPEWISLDEIDNYEKTAMEKMKEDATPKMVDEDAGSAKTFSQWFDEVEDSERKEYYPFDNYVKIFTNAECLRDATAEDIRNNAHKFYDVYDVDSVDREKAFNFASEELGLDYDVLYYACLRETPISNKFNESKGASNKNIQEELSTSERVSLNDKDTISKLEKIIGPEELYGGAILKAVVDVDCSDMKMHGSDEASVEPEFTLRCLVSGDWGDEADDGEVVWDNKPRWIEFVVKDAYLICYFEDDGDDKYATADYPTAYSTHTFKEKLSWFLLDKTYEVVAYEVECFLTDNGKMNESKSITEASINVDSKDKEALKHIRDYRAFKFDLPELHSKIEKIYGSKKDAVPRLAELDKLSDADIDKVLGEALTEDYRDTERISALATYLEVDEDSIQPVTYASNIFEVEGAEWAVFTEDEAEKVAKEDIENLYDDIGMDSFTPWFRDWIYDNAVDREWFEEALRESFENYVADIKDEDDRLQQEMDDVGVDTEEEFIDYLVSTAGDPIEYYVDNFGSDAFRDICSQNNLIDIDAVAEKAIEEDGVAHFIATYDGEEVDLGDGLFAYRLN